ncbi:hypothetical protein HDU84_004956 [Entophlyctis sp. JEL0112]|nr:hypothetical protein HDU84_004956 [Entophlyctis sp. JEL0112]
MDERADLKQRYSVTTLNDEADISPHESGVGGPTEYWTISEGTAIRTGFSCRECKLVIQVGEPVTVRDGRKMRFFYHRACYTGSADPRTQPGSSFYSNRFKGAIQTHAPTSKGFGKWSVSQYGYNDKGVWK